MAICKALVRTAVIGGLATGAVVVIAGPHRAAAMFNQARSAAVRVIDENIENPQLLRDQLQRMRGEYPERISRVAGELASVEGQIERLSRNRIVDLAVADQASADLGELTGLLEQAEAVRTEQPNRMINVRIDNRTHSLEAAYAEGNMLQQLVSVRRAAAADAEQEIAFLTEQHGQLDHLLGKLKTEQAQVDAQIIRLDAQIDSIERNAKMIEMVESRQKTLDELGSFESVSIEQFQAKMDKIRAEQKARLQAAFSRENASDYESRVVSRIQAEQAGKERFEAGRQLLECEPSEGAIEVGPQGVRDGGPASTGPVALAEPVEIR